MIFIYSFTHFSLSHTHTHTHTTHLFILPPQGWEETTDAAVTFLLRSVLNRGTFGVDGGGSGPPTPMPRDAPPTPELTMPADTNKLKKHLGILLEKITKGGAQLSLDSTSEMKIPGVW